MAQVLELLDGNLITPRGLCDVLDVVEEYTGTEIRQYIEDYLMEDPVEETEDERFDALRDHYRQILFNVKDECNELERLLIHGKRKEWWPQFERIVNMVNREINDDKDGGKRA